MASDGLKIRCREVDLGRSPVHPRFWDFALRLPVVVRLSLDVGVHCDPKISMAQEFLNSPGVLSIAFSKSTSSHVSPKSSQIIECCRIPKAAT
jgi:hypothetical protein